MQQQTIKLVAKGGEYGGAMVPDYEAQASGVRRFIGRRLDPSQGEPFVDPETLEAKRHAVFVPHEAHEAVIEKPMSSPFIGEYIKHLRHGDLLPGDEFTAQAAGVKFDPSFAGAAADSVGASKASDEGEHK